LPLCLFIYKEKKVLLLLPAVKLHFSNSDLPKHGNSIHAQIYPLLTRKFKPLLQDGMVYNLSFVQIKKANRMDKPIENDIMINFTRWTIVEKVVEIPPAFPVLTYSLTPIENLPSLVDNKE
jgi:replication factor A1